MDDPGLLSSIDWLPVAAVSGSAFALAFTVATAYRHLPRMLRGLVHAVLVVMALGLLTALVGLLVNYGLDGFITLLAGVFSATLRQSLYNALAALAGLLLGLLLSRGPASWR